MRRLVPVGIGLAGALLLALALPAAGARSSLAGGRAAFERVREGGGLTEAGWQRLIEGQQAALASLPEPGIAKAVAVVLQSRAMGLSGEPAVLLLERAREVLLSALEEAPADPIGWMQLAQLDAAMLDVAGSAASLAASFRSGPVSPELAVQRAALALGLWDWLAEPMLERARRELPPALRIDAAALVGVARATGRLEELRAAAAGDPRASAALERALAAATSPASARRGAG
ncbi:MAG: hypothetical protein N3D77_05635 [Geminicoccaceae bacterium]|nr:hypothetical protein [Geminicoccaceae bacterium]